MLLRRLRFTAHSRPVFRRLSAETHEFQTETRKLLDIVAHSIYTDKEVFLRELVSNASDALEKRRYHRSLGSSQEDAGALEISIEANKDAKTLTISDNGIGMTKEEVISNLGTIARSGSKAFVEQLKGKGQSRDGDGIIGQFGVGFYSAFMVADKVTVESLSASGEPSSGIVWESDGMGKYTVSPSSTSTPGSRITLHLKKECEQFSDPLTVKDVIKKYSNFVSFPVKVNGEVANTVSALWVQDKKTITETQYNEFYRFISNAFDTPKYTLHFSADAPIDLKALLFIPSFHSEKFGMGRLEMGVNLYSRKVLIESKPADLLPDWLRFIRGVVDSEDLPLSLSREKPQDSALIRRIREALTRRLLRFLDGEMKENPTKYKEFYTEFSFFLKEGICNEFALQPQIAKLLMFETSRAEGEFTSLAEYVSRLPIEEKHIYYLVAPNRKAALDSPYYETFKKHGKEVLFMYTAIDEFVMSSLKNFEGRSLTSAETSAVDLKSNDEAPVDSLSKEDRDALCSWLKTKLGAKVRDVKTTERLSDSPAIVTDHQSASLRRMLNMTDVSGAGRFNDLPPQTLEINPAHPIIRGLHLASKSETNDPMVELVVQQVLDNALIAAGLVDDARLMLPRINEILAATLKSGKQ